MASGKSPAFSLPCGTRYGKNGRREPEFAVPVLQLAGRGNQSPVRLFHFGGVFIVRAENQQGAQTMIKVPSQPAFVRKWLRRLVPWPWKNG